MKEKIARSLLGISIVLFGVYSTWWDGAYAKEVNAVPKPVHITGYCIHGKTADGTPTQEGICAYRPQDIGKIAIVYNKDMELIGTYEIHDTGSRSIRKGYTIDIWKETKEECYALTQEGYVSVVDPEDLQEQKNDP